MKTAHRGILLSALMTSGCALFQTTHLAPTAETAVVRSGQWGEFYRGGYVRIESISGHAPSWRNSQEVAVGGGLPDTDDSSVGAEESSSAEG